MTKQIETSRYDQAYLNFNRGWAAFSAAFESIGQGRTATTEHTIRAATWRSRWRLCRFFFGIAWRILWRGKVTVKL